MSKSGTIAWSDASDDELHSLGRSYRYLVATATNETSRAIYRVWLGDCLAEERRRREMTRAGIARHGEQFGKDYLADLRARADIVTEFDFLFPTAHRPGKRRDCPVCLANGHHGEVGFSSELFHCFRCHWAGDVFTLWQNLGFLALPFADAVRNVAARSGMPEPPRRTPPADAHQRATVAKSRRVVVSSARRNA